MMSLCGVAGGFFPAPCVSRCLSTGLPLLVDTGNASAELGFQLVQG